MIDRIASNPIPNRHGFESLARVGTPSSRQAGSSTELTPEQQRQVAELKNRDQEVRQHEQAHLAVGRDLIRGAPAYSYETGPDNKRYAVAGEVAIDTTPGRTPEETIPKAEHIRNTALAPAEPSAQDHRVAALAGQMVSDARAELARQQQAARIELSVTRFYGVQHVAGPVSDPGTILDFFA